MPLHWECGCPHPLPSNSLEILKNPPWGFDIDINQAYPAWLWKQGCFHSIPPVARMYPNYQSHAS